MGHHYIDERVDIFSLGIVLYELLAMREPFRGRAVRDTFDNILHLTPDPPSQVNAERRIPPALDAICLKALEKNPADRYQNVSAMVDEIDAFLEAALQSA